MIKRLVSSVIATAVFATASAFAQQFPTKPVTAIIPYSGGSGPDTVMRLVGEKLSRSLGQQVLVENRPGANGWIAIDAARKAVPDGHTVLQLDDTHMSLQPHIYKKLPHDITKDLEPVSPLYRTHFFVVVPAKSEWKSVGELIAAAKSKRGSMTYGTWGIGSVAHVGTAMLEAATGTEMTHVPFKELPQLYGAVANGEVAWAYGTAATAGPLYRASKVKFLALAAPKRLAGYDAIPTVAEAGGPANLEVGTWVGLLAPRGVPKQVVERINAEVAKALAEPEVRQRLNGVGFETYSATPEAMVQAMAADSRRYAEIAQRAKISLD